MEECRGLAWIFSGCIWSITIIGIPFGKQFFKWQDFLLCRLVQVYQLNELHEEKLVPLAQETNVDFIWVHGASTVLESTFLNAKVSEIFLPEVKHWVELKKGDMIGKIVDPLSGKVLDEVVAPVEGILFTIRDYPVVGEGALMGRLLWKCSEVMTKVCFANGRS